MRASIVTAAVLACTALSSPAAAAPVLRGADLRVTFSSPVACHVRLEVAIEGADAVEHRIEVLDGATVSLGRIEGAAVDGEPRSIGRTRSLRVRPQRPRYALDYSVAQPADAAFRCPVWLPAAPADGRSREVRIRAAVPAGAAPVGTMPVFAWAEGELAVEGTATLGHLPAFVRVPYAAPGVVAPMDVGRLMDTASLFVLAAASALWWRRGRR